MKRSFIGVIVAISLSLLGACDIGHDDEAPPPAVRVSQQAYVKASDTATNDRFGYSVALDNDTLAVGANREDGDGWDRGAVYVFTRTGTTWTQQQLLSASNPDDGDWFGYSVALYGDTLVVGAPYETSSATGINGDQSSNDNDYAGAVYVFTRSGATWTQQAYIKASNTEAYDEFGYSVALYGDTLAVGAWGEDSNATGVGGDQSNSGGSDSYDAGAVYVFTRTGTTWSQQAYVKASNTGPNDQFGRSVTLSGDTLAVGAWGEDGNATGVDGDGTNNAASSSGAVYVFSRTGTTWTQQAYAKASNTEANDTFGYSVALSGDTLAVGARKEGSNATGVGGEQTNNGATESGAVYVFTRAGTTWSQQAYIKASNTGVNDHFGDSVALSGDELAVGAMWESGNATGINGDQSNNAATYAGAAYIFTRTGTTWSQQAYVKASNPETNDSFGTSVALSGDTLAVGAQGEGSNATGIDGDQSNNAASSSGAVYVFE